MARTLEQIIAEINPNFQAQTKSLQDQQALIPGQIQTQETALGARKDSAFGDILSGARRRGTGVAFGGIPLAEQSKYLATDYMPALANLRSQGQQQAMSLQDAILGINERRDTLGQQIYQTEQDRAFQASEAAKNRATQKSVYDYFNQAQQPQATQPTPTWGRNRDGGFDFYDAGGKRITAGAYATQTKQDIRDVLYDMGAEDQNAAKLYNILRQIPDNQINQALARLTPDYQHILSGYALPAPFKALGGSNNVTAPKATLPVATPKAATSYSPFSNAYLGGIR
jgi:hypothetical protein